MLGTRNSRYDPIYRVRKLPDWMRWTAPITRISMSEFGYKQTSSRPKSTSALPPGADILVAVTDFRCC